MREKKLKEREYKKQCDDALNQFRINYWINEGHLADEIIKKAYWNGSPSMLGKWSLLEDVMRNYLQACYAARKTEWLMATVHNPNFIKKLWSFPLYLFVWDTYLRAGNEFAAPYCSSYSADAYDIERLMLILNIIHQTFYHQVLKPIMSTRENIKIADFYLKNYK